MKNTLIKVGSILAIVIVAYLAWQAYSTFKEGERVQAEAAALITEYEQLKENEAAYQQQINPYQSERLRCAEFVRQDSGDFSEFAYCQRYLELGDSR